MEAEACYRTALQTLTHGHGGVYNNLGVLLRKQNRFPEAVEALTEAATLSPGNAQFVRTLEIVRTEYYHHMQQQGRE